MDDDLCNLVQPAEIELIPRVRLAPYLGMAYYAGRRIVVVAVARVSRRPLAAHGHSQRCLGQAAPFGTRDIEPACRKFLPALRAFARIVDS